MREHFPPKCTLHWQFPPKLMAKSKYFPYICVMLYFHPKTDAMQSMLQKYILNGYYQCCRRHERQRFLFLHNSPIDFKTFSLSVYWKCPTVSPVMLSCTWPHLGSLFAHQPKLSTNECERFLPVIVKLFSLTHAKTDSAMFCRPLCHSCSTKYPRQVRF